MSVEIYDSAVVEKMKEVFSNTLYAPTDEAFKRCAELNSGKVMIPMISIYRPSAFEIDNRNYNKPEFFKGRRMELLEPELGEGETYLDVDPEKIRNIRSLSVMLRYQMDVWGDRMNVVNEITKELIFFLLEFPNIEVKEPISGMDMKFSVQLEEGITDNTDIMGFQDRGKVYRNTIEFFVREARLFSYLDFGKLVRNIEIKVYHLDDLGESVEGLDPDKLIEIGEVED